MGDWVMVKTEVISGYIDNGKTTGDTYVLASLEIMQKSL